ncbi:MAG: LarC family nickel insertion protein [Candidatus Eisenbacteria bacterium]|uniref:Putative nickel insertion protein n=1 Tax=Eiseniibacteriota bacterium TaxID=2212470 RepID=A0A938BPQ7_UNCEI|nr:LarC family nickel insertion protein [Candidatus Eisenbacteria bacterium]
MRIAYLDCAGGISGDMFVGALLDAGWPEAALRETTAWLGGEIAELAVERRRHQAFAGLGIRVTPSPGAPHERRLDEVLALLDGAPLPPAVRLRAEAVFRRLAGAEGRAHGARPDAVHFHELGAVDALVDIVAACAGIQALGIESLHVSPLPLARGLARSAHGPMPLPAPAAAFLLEGLAVEWRDGGGERCTPTGVALVAEFSRGPCPPPMRISRVGVGAGTSSWSDVPNLARLFVGEAAIAEGGAPGGSGGAGWPGATGGIPAWGWGETGPGGAGACPGRWGWVAVIETQIDDAPPEELAWLAGELRAAGALEVFLQPIQMKKGRLAALLTLICRPEQEPSLMARLLMGSTTLGARRRLELRRELDRRQAIVRTPYGAIVVQLADRGPAGWTAKPEYESCREAAERAGVSLPEVRRAAREALDADAGPAPESAP